MWRGPSRELTAVEEIVPYVLDDTKQVRGIGLRRAPRIRPPLKLAAHQFLTVSVAPLVVRCARRQTTRRLLPQPALRERSRIPRVATLKILQFKLRTRSVGYDSEPDRSGERRVDHFQFNLTDMEQPVSDLEGPCLLNVGINLPWPVREERHPVSARGDDDCFQSATQNGFWID